MGKLYWKKNAALITRNTKNGFRVSVYNAIVDNLRGRLTKQLNFDTLEEAIKYTEHENLVVWTVLNGGPGPEYILD